MKATKTRQTQDRPRSIPAYPGSRSLQFRAALAGARLAKHLADDKHLAETVGEFFALDRLNSTYDVAEFKAEKLARLANAALVRVKALRERHQAWFAYLLSRNQGAPEQFETLVAKPTRKTKRAA